MDASLLARIDEALGRPSLINRIKAALGEDRLDEKMSTKKLLALLGAAGMGLATPSQAQEVRRATPVEVQRAQPADRKPVRSVDVQHQQVGSQAQRLASKIPSTAAIKDRVEKAIAEHTQTPLTHWNWTEISIHPSSTSSHSDDEPEWSGHLTASNGTIWVSGRGNTMNELDSSDLDNFLPPDVIAQWTAQQLNQAEQRKEEERARQAAAQEQEQAAKRAALQALASKLPSPSQVRDAIRQAKADRDGTPVDYYTPLRLLNLNPTGEMVGDEAEWVALFYIPGTNTPVTVAKGHGTTVTWLVD
jgi:hypothetical protein